MATVAEVLADGGSGKGSIVLHGGRVGGGSADDDGIRQRTMFLEVLHQCGYCRGLLADGYIDAIDGFACLVEATLIDNGIDSDGGLSSLTVADDKLTLATAIGIIESTALSPV